MLVDFAKDPTMEITAPEKVPYTSDEHDLVDLDESNFTSFLQNNERVLVVFYTHWDGFAPQFSKNIARLSMHLKNQDLHKSHGKVALVECESSPGLCSQYAPSHVQLYPNMHFFLSGKQSIEYQYPRGYLKEFEDRLLGFMETPMTMEEASQKAMADPSRKKLFEDDMVVVLNDYNAMSVLSQPNTTFFLMFLDSNTQTTNTCTSPDSLFADLANNRKDPHLTFAAVDCAVDVETCAQFGAKKLPFFIHIVSGGSPPKSVRISYYDGATEDHKLVQFLNEQRYHTGDWETTAFAAATEGKVKPGYPTLMKADQLQEFSDTHPRALILFYSIWSGVPKPLEEVFVTASQLYSKRDNPAGVFAAVDCGRSASTTSPCGARGVVDFPFIGILRSGKLTRFHWGARDLQAHPLLLPPPELTPLLAFMNNPEMDSKHLSLASGEGKSPKVTLLTDDTFYYYLRGSSEHALVLFLGDRDDTVTQNYLRALLAVSEENKSPGWAFFAIDCSDEAGNCRERETQYLQTGVFKPTRELPVFQHFYKGARSQASFFDYNAANLRYTKEQIFHYMKYAKPVDKTPPLVDFDKGETVGQVEVLDMTNFTRAAREHKSIFVMFHAWWCGYSRSAKYEFIKASTRAKQQGIQAYFAAMEITHPMNIAFQTELGVSGYPAFFYMNFTDDGMKYVSKEYKDASFAPTMIEFLKDPFQPPPPPPVPEPFAPDKTDKEIAVEILTETNFAMFKKNNLRFLLMFYTPGCGFCQKQKPLILGAAEKVGVLEGIQTRVAAVNAWVSPLLAKEYNITNLPTYLYFERGEFQYKLRSQFHSEDDVVDFLKNPQPPVVEPLVPFAGGRDHNVLILTDQNFKKEIQSGLNMLVMFYQPGCDVSKSAMGPYVQAAKELNDGVYTYGRLAAFDCSTLLHDPLCTLYDAVSLPTFTLFKNGERYMNYYFAVTAEQLIAFMKDPTEPVSDETEDDFLEGTHAIDAVDASNFQRYRQERSDTELLVLAYSPVCSYCKNVRKTLFDASLQIKARSKGGRKYQMAAVNCLDLRNRPLCSNLEALGTPSLTYVGAASETGFRAQFKWEVEIQRLTADDIVEYVTETAGASTARVHQEL